MATYKYLFALMLAIFLSCTNSAPPTPTDTDHSVLFLFGYDRSGTFSKFPPIDTVMLGQMVDHFMTQFPHSTFAFTPIGNSTDLPFLRFQMIQPRVDKNAVLSQRALQHQRANQASSHNRLVKKELLSRYLLSLTQPTTKWTDLNQFLQKSAYLLNEPAYQNTKKVLLIYSDGFHDTHRDTTLVCQLEHIPDLELCLIGWKNANTCQVPNTIRFESPEGFLRYLEHSAMTASSNRFLEMDN